MLMYRTNIEFPQGDFVAHQKKKVAKTWEGLERLDTKNDKSMKIKITNLDARVNVKIGGMGK